jgi:hypothetical protein
MQNFAIEVNSPEDAKKLVNLGVTREEWVTKAHFGKNASYTPHVNTSRVMFPPQQNLWCAIPERDNFMGISSKRDTERPGQPKISEFEGSVLVDEDYNHI